MKKLAAADSYGGKEPSGWTAGNVLHNFPVEDRLEPGDYATIAGEQVHRADGADVAKGTRVRVLKKVRSGQADCYYIVSDGTGKFAVRGGQLTAPLAARNLPPGREDTRGGKGVATFATGQGPANRLEELLDKTVLGRTALSLAK